MHRWIVLAGFFTACGSTQTTHTFTAPVAQDQAFCRAEKMMRTGPWMLAVDAKRERIHARSPRATTAVLPGTHEANNVGVPAVWGTTTRSGSHSAPRSQRVERNIVVTIGESPPGQSTVRVSVEDVACIDDGSSFHGACSVTYPGTDEVNDAIRTVGRALRLWLRGPGNSCESNPASAANSP